MLKRSQIQLIAKSVFIFLCLRLSSVVAQGNQDLCENLFPSNQSELIHGSEPILSLKSFYQSYRTLTLVSNPEDAVEILKFLQSLDFNQKILRVPNKNADIYHLRSAPLLQYRHLIAHEVFTNDEFLKMMPVVIDLRDKMSVKVNTEVLENMEKLGPATSMGEVREDSFEQITRQFDQSIPVGKPYFPEDIDIVFYNKLNEYFLRVLKEENLSKIFPKREEDPIFYARFHALRRNYPLGWWQPLSAKVIEFLEHKHLKGSFQEALDYQRAQQLSEYIIEHQKDQYWLPVQNAGSPLNDWFHHIQRRGLNWKSLITQQAWKVVRQREKLDQSKKAAKTKVRQRKIETSVEKQKFYQERYKILSEYIVDHQNEEDVARIFPQPQEFFQERRWAREHLRESKKQFFQSLSFEAQEVLRKRGLDQMEHLPAVKPGRKNQKTQAVKDKP